MAWPNTPTPHACAELQKVNAARHEAGDIHPINVVQVQRYGRAENAWYWVWGCYADWDVIEGDSFYTCSPITFCPFCSVRLPEPAPPLSIDAT